MTWTVRDELAARLVAFALQQGADYGAVGRFVAFALSQADASGLPYAKLLCRFNQFAQAEWEDFRKRDSETSHLRSRPV